MVFKKILYLVLLFLCNVCIGQNDNEKGTRADSLRGSQRPERTCYDLTSYDLHIRVDTLGKLITGSNRISYKAVDNFKTLQIDLFSNMAISRILSEGAELKFRREFNAVFVDLNTEKKKGESGAFTVYFSGKPLIAKNPPWDGGFVWTKDNNGKAWIAVACQGTGASLWWPCKEDLSDEPEQMSIHCNVPAGLRCVANGNEELMQKSEDGTVTYHWNISYPINNYNVSLNIGDYAHLHDTYTSPDGDTLSLDYYVLKYNVEKALEQFEQVKPMLSCYEKFLGKYPFWKDGYALIETPYLGMEHQSGIAYGNKFKTGYMGMDRSGMKLPFDYIIIHETGHEWWGNSVSAKDMADMWIHESFCTYSESIYVECLYGYDTAMIYVNALKATVGNAAPIMGTYGLNREGHSDMYVKGMLFLNTLRHVVNDDDLWWSIVKNMSDTTFKMTNIDYNDVTNLFIQKTGLPLKEVFEQYVKKPSIPQFEYLLKKRRTGYVLKYRWGHVVKGFQMPIDILTEDKKKRLFPTQSWQKIKLTAPLNIDKKCFYVREKNIRQ